LGIGLTLPNKTFLNPGLKGGGHGQETGQRGTGGGVRRRKKKKNVQ
jgi:hypothetical protein